MKKTGESKTTMHSCANVKKNKELDAIKVCPLLEIDDEDWGYSLPVRRKNVLFFYKKRDYKMMELENGLLMMIYCFLMMNRTQQVESVSIG